MKSPVSLPFAATALALLGTILTSSLADHRIPEPLAVPLKDIDVEIEGWSAASDRTIPAPTLRALDPTSYLSRAYRKGRVDLDLFVAFYTQQRAGESMHSPKHCLPGSGWEIWKHDAAMIPAGAGQVKINKCSIENLGTRMLMFYW